MENHLGNREDLAQTWQDAPELALDVDRLVVLAAHPGDETIGAGGLIARAHRLGVDVSVIVVTDDPDDPLRRRLELTSAVNALAPGAGVTFLAVPRGAVRRERPFVSESVAAHVAAARARRTLIAAPWWREGDADHDVLGDVARAFAAGGIRVVAYPLQAEPTADARVLRLDDADTDAKRRAAAAYTSVPADALARPFEAFVAPAAGEGATWTTARFDSYYQITDDPWGLNNRWYELRKRTLLLAMLPRERYTHALELGCATGVFTRMLADNSDEVLGVDLSQVALDMARANGVPDNVTLELCELPREWPEGRFDLLVLSEVAYYWTPEQFGEALDKIDRSATEDAVFAVCHWRKTKEGTPLTGDDVHAAIGARPEWSVLARHVETDFLMDVFVRPGTPSVAEADA